MATVKQNQNKRKSDGTTGWLLLAALLPLVFAIGAQAQSAPDASSAPGPNRWILVSIPDRELAGSEGDTALPTFPVSGGAAERLRGPAARATPTPAASCRQRRPSRPFLRAGGLMLLTGDRGAVRQR